MIQESFQAMQGDLHRFRDLRDVPQLFESVFRRDWQGPECSREEEGTGPFKMIEGQFRDLPPTAGSFEEAGLYQIGLMDILEGPLIFLDCRR